MRIETLAVHAGLRVYPTTGAVAPPLHTATTRPPIAHPASPMAMERRRGR